MTPGKANRSIGVLLAAVLAIAMLAAGCGDDSSGSEAEAGSAGGSDADISVEPSSLSRAQFVKRANKICSQGQKTVATLFFAEMRKLAKEDGLTEEELNADAFQAGGLPGIEDQIEAIRDLGAPSGEEAQIEAYLAAMWRGVEELHSLERISLQGEKNSIDPAFEQAGRLARQFGIAACAYG